MIENLKVSVCITSWNTATALRANLRMLVAEIGDGLSAEVLVYDNASKDGTAKLLAVWKHHIKSISSGTNQGQSISRNEMARQAIGDYILFVDGDIGIIPQSVGAMSRWLDAHPNSVGVSYDIDSDTHFTGEETQAENVIIREDVVQRPYMYFHYALYRKEFIRKHPLPQFYPFDRPGWGLEEDVAALQAPGQMYDVIIGRRFYHHKAEQSKNNLSGWPGTRVKRLAMLEYVKTLPEHRRWEAFHTGKLEPKELYVAPLYLGTARSSAAYAALEDYLPFVLIPTDGAPGLLLEHDLPEASTIKPGDTVIPARYSPLWLTACDPVSEADPVVAIHTWQLVEAALRGRPAALRVAEPDREELKRFGLSASVTRQQALAYREYVQRTMLNRVIAPLTTMLLSHGK